MLLYYCLPITSQCWGIKEDSLFSLISSERKDKIKNYHHTIDKKLSLYAELLARIGLSHVSGLPISSIQFSYSSNGKPFWKGYPYYFNFSHTKNFILCCISTLGNIGADVEKIDNAPFEIMKIVFHPSEISYIQNAPIEKKNYYFYKIWTQKESYTKFTGTGIIEDLRKINVLDPVYSPYFYTWLQDDYLCSVYSECPEKHQFIHISEDDVIVNFLKN